MSTFLNRGERHASRDAGQRHYEQAIEYQARAERGDEATSTVDAPMTRDQQLLAANTHTLLAIYFELRHQTGMM